VAQGSHRWASPPPKRPVEDAGSLEARLRAMTPEQRHTRLMELQAKVDAVVAWPLVPIPTDAEDAEEI
jgi:hypothetical protein